MRIIIPATKGIEAVSPDSINTDILQNSFACLIAAVIIEVFKITNISIYKRWF